MTDLNIHRLRESVGQITASLNALKAEMDLLSRHDERGSLRDEKNKAPIGTPLPLNEEWLPLRWLRDAPVLPPPGGDMQELLAPVFERLREVVRVERFVLFLSERGEDRLTPRASQGFRRDDLRTFSLGVREGICGRAFHEGRPIVVSGGGPWNGQDPLLAGFPVREAIAIPVRSAEKIVGVLFAGRTSPVPFEARDQVLLVLLADRIGTWLHADSFFAQMREQVHRREELVRLSLKVASSRKLSEISAATSEAGARLLRVEIAAIVLADSAGVLTIQGGVGLPAGLEAEWQGQRGEGVEGKVVQDGQRFVNTDLLAAGSLPLPFGSSCPVRALIILPLKAQDETVGCLVLADPVPRDFSPEEVELVTLLAAQAALAMENARLYDQARRSYDELKAAQEQLIRSERTGALTEIAGGIAHDFNNILAIILGTTELLLERDPNPPTRKGLETIEEAAWRGAETVRRLQGFAATGGEAEFVAVDLNRLILDAVEATRPRWKDEAEARGLRVGVFTDLAETPPILGNPVELRELLVNLLFNALDAMPEGGQVLITSHPQGDMVEITLADTGIGMAEETRRRIFDPFFTTKGPRHSGLGLAVVHGVLGRHRGQVEVISREGQGTTFRLRFPVSAEARALRTSPPQTKPSGPLTEPPPSARILVIENELTLRSLLVQVLMNAGHTVRWAEDGQAGLTLFEKEEFDVVLTDLSMPEVSGWEVAQAVKKAHPGVPVILMTGWGEQSAPQHLEQRGVDLVLAKPFRVEELLSAVADALALRRPFPSRV